MTNLIKSTYVGGALILAAMMAAGCGAGVETTTTLKEPAPAVAESKASVDAEGKVVAYRNDEGSLICPVMGTVIKEEKDAVGHQDYEGKRYYFCCGGCPDQFKAEPTKYVKK